MSLEIDDFISENWAHYKEGLAEYFDYTYCLEWDTAETRLAYCNEFLKEEKK